MDIDVKQVDNTDDVMANTHKAFRISVFDLYQKIIKKTPVDSGQARLNWMINLNHLDVETKYSIYNSLPYMSTLEYGLYGKPRTNKAVGYIGGQTIAGSPRLITGGTRRHSGVRITNQGYSKQAPSGIVRIASAEAEVNVETRILGYLKK